MRIIQSFWSKPLRVSEDPSRAAKMNFGWPVRKYNYFSLALSCLQLASYYPDLELVTDDFGENLLIHKLQLPYKSVRSELNKLDDYHSGLWALGKIYSYSIQDGPFLHVDSDLFIFREFDRNIGSARLVAQKGNGNPRIYQCVQTGLPGLLLYSGCFPGFDECPCPFLLQCGNNGRYGYRFF